MREVPRTNRRTPDAREELAQTLATRGLVAISGGFESAQRGRLRADRGSVWGEAGFSGGRSQGSVAEMRRVCRAAVRNGEIASTIVQGAVDLDIMDGFVLRASTKARAWNKRADELFNAWAGDKHACDLYGLNTLDGFAAIADASWFTDGDVGVLLVDDGPGRLQVIEADRIRNPDFKPDSKTLCGGFERDESGRLVKVHIAEWDDYGLSMKSTRSVDPEVLLHLPNPMDLTATLARRVPQLQAAVRTLERMESIDEAVQVSMWIAACMAAFIARNNPQDDDAFDAQEESEVGPSGNTVTRKTETMGPGMIKRLGIGESVTFSQPGQPGANADQHLRMQVAKIGALVGVPQCMLLLDGAGLNLSTIRCIIQLAWRRALRRQEALRLGLYLPVRRWWTARAIRRGDLPFVNGWDKCEAIAPPAPVMDPRTDIAAGLEAVKAGFTSRRRVAMQTFGHDLPDIDRERAEDQKAEAELGIRIETTPGATVTGGEPVKEEPEKSTEG